MALILVAMVAFAQAHAALASPCPMSAMAMEMPCDDCETPLQVAHDGMPSLCATQCATADQPAALAAAFLVAKVEQPVLTVRVAAASTTITGLAGPPAGAPPPRILLHSFLT